MSSLIVEVCIIEDILPHPNADKVEMARVKNWWCVVPKGVYKPHDRVVYFPPDSVISEDLANRFGVAKYLSPLGRNPDGSKNPGLRIRAQRFRGEQSFGLIVTPDDTSWETGTSVVDHYGVRKYEPQLHCTDGDAAKPVLAFHAYTDIEHMSNFPNVLEDEEEVVVDEKLHGQNIRVGKILTSNLETGIAEFQYMCGSHGQRRKEFDNNGNRSKFWKGLTPQIRNLLDYLCDDKNNVIVFGEFIGQGLQDMTYGRLDQVIRAFDISLNGKYMDYDQKEKLFKEFSVETVPFLYRGPFSVAKIKELTDGPTCECDPDQAGKFKGREGVVVRPVKERYSSLIPNFGRVIFKSVSVDYLSRKAGTEFR